MYYLSNTRSPCYINQSRNKLLSIKRIGIRAYSTSTSSTDSSALVVFSDADKEKLDILNYIKGKSGIYM